MGFQGSDVIGMIVMHGATQATTKWFFGMFLSLAVLAGCHDDTAGSPNESVDAVDGGAVDVPELPPPDSSGTGGEIEPGGLGSPCESNKDCDSLFCVAGPDGFYCTVPCLTECPEGYLCKQVTNAGSDLIFLCVPDQNFDECHAAANGTPCDDGNACTVGDDCEDGWCLGGLPLDCDDGDPCTEPGCNFKSGCEYIPVDAACDDGDQCTMEDFCQDGQCVGSGAQDCVSDDPCVTGACAPFEGCVYEPVVCDDGDPLTVDYCALDGCKHVEVCDKLVDDTALCVVSGSAGDVVDCELRLASASLMETHAFGLQIKLGYPENLLTLSHFTACPSCQDTVPPMALSTGHFVALAPAIAAEWDGGGEILIINLGVPSPITTAFYDGGNVQGSAQFMTAHFIVDVDVPASAGISVVLVEAEASDGNAAPLGKTIKERTILTEKIQIPCELNGAPCDDFNACTVQDLCVAKVCAGEEHPCDDGDSCTYDHCDVNVGCFSGLAPDGCACDDGNACTIETTCQSGICLGDAHPSCQ
jgi:hypothetical protein